MRALSLLQPWAQLLVTGVKTIETRAWQPKFKGTLYIHASSGHHEDVDKIISYCREKNLPLADQLTKGAIIGSVDVQTYGRPKELLTAAKAGIKGLTMEDWERECILGDLSGPGRWGWLVTGPVLFKNPITCKGALSVWSIPESLEAAIEQERDESMVCRVCGCSWFDPCWGGCSWVETNLCSKCATHTTSKKTI
jgi:hypothetical protein